MAVEQSHQDWLCTFLAAAGQTDVRERLLKGHSAGNKQFRVHIDGYNLLPYLSGEAKESPRNEFYYVNDDGQLVALRYGDWKVVFMEQRAKTLALWAEPFVSLRILKIFHLRRDPFERADEHSNTYYDWLIDHAFLLIPAQNLVAQQLLALRTAAGVRPVAALSFHRAGLPFLLPVDLDATHGVEVALAGSRFRSCTGLRAVADIARPSSIVTLRSGRVLAHDCAVRVAPVSARGGVIHRHHRVAARSKAEVGSVAATGGGEHEPSDGQALQHGETARRSSLPWRAELPA